jgi:hypothetical protein
MKNKLFYKFNNPSNLEHSLRLQISDYLEEGSPSGSCWFRSLPTNLSKFFLGEQVSSIRGLMTLLTSRASKGDSTSTDLLKTVGTFSTAKTCPGIRGVLANSVLVKCPMDIQISVASTGTWAYRTAREGLLEIGDEHPPAQVSTRDGLNNIFDGYKFLKIKLPLLLATRGVSYIHLQPQYHVRASEYFVMNGVMSGRTTYGEDLNIIIGIKLPPEGETIDIAINAGDILAYLWAEKPMKVIEDTSISKTPKTKFIGSFDGK